jgi:glycosyltransferase involved in cell wall biosynthesis
VSPTTVAAIVPTLDRPQWLERSLAALAAAAPAFAEIWVVDQSAGEQGRALCERFGARWLHLDRRGISHARNTALPHVRAEWVAFPDDDAEVAADVIAQLEKTLARHPDVAFIGAHVAFPDGRPMQPGMDGRARTLASPPDVLRTTVSPGLFVRRDWITRAGGFDERFGVGAEFPSGEESDLLFTILRSGGTGWYEPAIHVRHPDPFAIRDERGGRRRMADYGVGLGALLAKHSQGGSGAVYAALQRRLTQRAAVGAAAMMLSGRFARAQHFAAAFRGRRAGWKRWFERDAAPATPAQTGAVR